MTALNTRYPGRPHYTGPKSGFFLLIHHGQLVEYSHDIFERLDYIDKMKPESERAWRRHCIVSVKLSELPLEIVVAYAIWDKAYATWDKARATWDKAHATRDKAYTTREKACATRDKAYATWNKAYATWDKALRANNDHLTTLLTKHVPNHTWNGEELVFK